MTRQEFLQELRLALQGQLSQTAINENIRYYDNYIMEETRKGSSEHDVVSRLGSPRLIARTLIDTTDPFGRAAGGRHYAGDYEQAASERRFHVEDSVDREPRNLRLYSWLGKFLLIAVAILIVVVVANVIAFLLPILVPVIVGFLIYSLFFGNRS